MKKIFWLFFWVFVLFLLSWCGEKYSYTVRFDNKSFDFLATQEYQQVWVNSINSNYLADNLIVVYTPKKSINDDVFVSNLLVSSVVLDDVDLSVFVDENIQKLQQMFVWYNIEKTNDISFVCDNKIINATMNTFNIVEEEIDKDLYFGEYFFIHKWYWFVISFVSEDKSERNLFELSLSSLSCD